MGQYYYTVSSLPYLNFDNIPDITVNEFIEICKSTLSDNDFNTVKSVSIKEFAEMDSSNPVVARWISWETSLRNELAKLRGAALEVDSDSYMKDAEISTSAPVVARNVFKMESPLKAEEAMNLARWELLDEIEVCHYFDLEKLIIYSLRLQILERKSLLVIESGNQNFQVIYENIKETVREA